MREYPDAKVVVTLRDQDTWWNSVIASIHSDALPPGKANRCRPSVER